jgi:DNA-binding LacI/PurR family transcriptional regulator
LPLKANIPIVNIGYVFYGNNFMHSGYLAVRQFVNLPYPPAAIVTANDTLAIGCLKYCLQKNIKIPEEMAIIGHDNIIFSEIYEPPAVRCKKTKSL